MRSLLFVPGNSPKMITKAASSDADVVIYDLEDAVHPDSKEATRPIVIETLRNHRPGQPQSYVRVNALDTKWCEEDLAAVIPAEPDGIMIPKVMGPEDITRLSALIERWEVPARKGKTGIIPVCTETPEATLSLAAHSWKHPRLAGLLWGAEDLAAAIGATTNREQNGHYSAPFMLARSLCLMAAHAAGVSAIDAVFTNFRDNDALAQETNTSRRDGFTAKAAIHPAQIKTINECFTPTEEERRWAERVISAFGGRVSGVAQLDGTMLDAPHLTRAKRILLG